MVVLDAQRYGLAQLHQLRGRVGRGAAKSFCILVYPDDAGDSRAASRFLRDRPTASRSPKRICACAVPASLPAPLQSGAADLRLGDLLRDVDVYRAAKLAAEKIVATDPHLQAPNTRDCVRCSRAQPSTRALVMSS